ncbi:DUF5320 domain-containing protein [bacterium]|nr:DUF5320 domain-containing protein [bacterium]
MFGGFGRGWRHWWRLTGLPGWARAARGLPAWGSGYCWWYPFWTGFPTREEEKSLLKEQAEQLKQVLADIEKRLEELEKKSEE